MHPLKFGERFAIIHAPSCLRMVWGINRNFEKCHHRRHKSLSLEAFMENYENIHTEERLKICFQKTHNYLVFTFIIQIKQYNNNHLNKIDKHLDMFSFRLIDLTITCNELLWSNSISFSFLLICFFLQGKWLNRRVSITFLKKIPYPCFQRRPCIICLFL